MLDLRRIRSDPEGVLARLRRRNPALDISRLLALDEERRKIQQEVDELRRRQNEGSERISELSRTGQMAEREKLLAELKAIAEQRKKIGGKAFPNRSRA